MDGNTNQIPIDVILKWVNDKKILKYIKSNLDLIDLKVFPNLENHNVYHALSVALLAMVLSSFYDIDEINRKILLDACLLHDIGRINEELDLNHGYISSIMAESVLESQLFYSGKQNLSLLKTLIFGHSENIYNISIFAKNGVERSYDKVILLKIIKDADILDRVRLKERIDLKYFNLEVSQRLLEFAYFVNKNALMQNFLEKGEKYELPNNNR